MIFSNYTRNNAHELLLVVCNGNKPIFLRLMIEMLTGRLTWRAARNVGVLMAQMRIAVVYCRTQRCHWQKRLKNTCGHYNFRKAKYC